ncbi:MAG TPA: hypothetical protein VHF69_00550 [Candidatus Synoicihabitans sp.]|nr:hypothetical protein [Candidatus Synoicihabitans sp.]
MPSHKVFFGTLAHEYVRENNEVVPDVARRIKGVPVVTTIGQFTKWKTGRWQSIPEKKLMQVIEAITSDPRKQAHLIIAYLVDMTPLRLRPYIDLGLHGQVQGGRSAASFDGEWSADVRRKLEAIGNAYLRSDDFRRMVDNMSGWARRINEEHECPPSPPPSRKS